MCAKESILSSYVIVLLYLSPICLLSVSYLSPICLLTVFYLSPICLLSVFYLSPIFFCLPSILLHSYWLGCEGWHAGEGGSSSFLWADEYCIFRVQKAVRGGQDLYMLQSDSNGAQIANRHYSSCPFILFCFLNCQVFQLLLSCCPFVSEGFSGLKKY